MELLMKSRVTDRRQHQHEQINGQEDRREQSDVDVQLKVLSLEKAEATDLGVLFFFLLMPTPMCTAIKSR